MSKDYKLHIDLKLVLGIVGSDPYLAPEVYDQGKYDPTKVDIWSLAIIYCCMTLRRFPWKCPRTSDNSFRLFITQPTDEELRSPLYPKALGETVVNQSLQTPDGSQSTHHHHHSRGSVGTSSTPDSSSIATQSTGASNAQAQTIKGPWRLLRLLPRDSRPILARMLELNPKKRATLEDIVSDPWVKKSQFCRQEIGGGIFNCDNHTHILEAGGSATPTPSKDKK
jgi:serine/threonine protein kinase